MKQPRLFDPIGAAFGLLLPFLAAATMLLLTRFQQSRLPAEVATHWSGDGADSFSAPMTAAWTMVLVVVLVGAGCCSIAVLAQAQLMMRRYMLVTGLAVTGLLVGLYVGGLVAQLDLTDAAQASLPMWPMVAGMWIGTAVGWVGARLLRDLRQRTKATAPPAASLPRGRADLPIVEQVGTGTGTTLVLALVIAIPVLIVCAATRSWWMLGLAVPVGVLVLGLIRFTVTVDERGVHVSNLAAHALDYDLDEITGAQVTETRPFQDWGGWGLRTKGRGRYGLVTTSGPALVITTESGQEFTVTTSRAEEMAGALNTLADRRR